MGYGFFGNLEVFSVEAFNTLAANIQSCSQRIDWVKGTKWGPIGEDLFAQMCMDDNGVSRRTTRSGSHHATCWGRQPCTLSRSRMNISAASTPPCASAESIPKASAHFCMF